MPQCLLDNRKISSYILFMRRKANTLIPIEEQILSAGLALRQGGDDQFHGFLIAKEIAEGTDARRMTAQGTLYKALDRMAKAGLLSRCWEDPEIAAQEGRPRRRFYQITAQGEQALADAARARQSVAPLRATLEGQ